MLLEHVRRSEHHGPVPLGLPSAPPLSVLNGGTAELRLDASAASVPTSRSWARTAARAVGSSSDAVELAELLTSELVTNAVRYGPVGGLIVVRARRDGPWFDITVTDENRNAPVVRDATTGEIGGRGLHLVQELAVRWGFTLHLWDGKSVWFQIDAE